MAEEKPSRPNEEAAGGGDNKESEEEEISVNEDSEAGSLTSPDAIINFIIAGIFDAIGLIPIVGSVSDIIAGIYFLIWMIATGKKGWPKFLLALILMFIPIVSDIAPFVSLFGMFLNIKLPTSWIGCVYSILMGGGGTKKANAGVGGGAVAAVAGGGK